MSNAYINEAIVYTIFYEQLVMSDNLIDLEIEAIDRILTKINPNYNSLKAYEDFELDGQTEEFKLWWKVREMGLSSRKSW